jgi:3-hydroxyisobutyrate dehydrogenase-like beta-hydroxyacid dehydrogenase
MRAQIMQSNLGKIQCIAMIGFGEAGGILGSDLAARTNIRVYDILLHSDQRVALEEKTRAAGALLCTSLRDAIEGADLIISAVTASAAKEVAGEAARYIKEGQCFLDINSISPEAKKENAAVIEATCATYVEVAVMAPVPPQRLKVPLLLGGPKAIAVAEGLQLLGMNATAVSERIGVASAIKMCRSIMIKGLEALAVESLFTARRYDAEDAVLASLHASFPALGWNGVFADYLVSRVAEHGRRRAAEMREVSLTVSDVGMRPVMTDAIAIRQDQLVDAMQAENISYSHNAFSWRELADALIDSKGDRR